MPATQSYSRKPGFHYGWDWAPKMLTCGIFKPVYIRAYDHVRLEYPLFRNSKITEENPSSVQLYGHLALKLGMSGTY